MKRKIIDNLWVVGVLLAAGFCLSACDSKSHYGKEVPFEVPESWEWVKLKEVFEVNPKNNLDDDMDVSFIPMALISDGFSNKHNSDLRKWKDIKKGFTHFQEGDVAVAKITPCFENRKSVILSDLKNNNGAGTTELHILRPIVKSVIPNYTLWFIKTEYFISHGVSNFSGAVGQQRVSKKILEETWFPLPPLSEQFRIVAEVERLFSLVEIIEDSKLKIEHLISQTKSKVLDLAIHGKLVPQDPNDEPASALLEQIRREQKPKKNTTDKFHYPFEIPKGWLWVTLGEIGTWQSGSTPRRNIKDYYNGDIPWLKTGDLTDGLIYEIPETITQKALSETSVKVNPPGSVLIAMYGATIGKVGILTTPATTNQACCACSDFKGITNLYLFNVLIAYREYFIQLGEGGAQPNISKEKIVSTYIPLPPINEQKLIVSQIEKIFALLDMIGESLKA